MGQYVTEKAGCEGEVGMDSDAVEHCDTPLS